MPWLAAPAQWVVSSLTIGDSVGTHQSDFDDFAEKRDNPPAWREGELVWPARPTHFVGVIILFLAQANPYISESTIP
ncbi:MAG: hypothetical protein HYX68_19590 [Planctomycetes bacterium]|jgi:hypothetical protein|nr:hypothetical protein [Planctomycetota bacterium]